MMKYDVIKKYPEDTDLLEDVIIENKQAIEMADIYTGILSGMMDAFASRDLEQFKYCHEDFNGHYHRYDSPHCDCQPLRYECTDTIWFI